VITRVIKIDLSPVILNPMIKVLLSQMTKGDSIQIGMAMGMGKWDE